MINLQDLNFAIHLATGYTNIEVAKQDDSTLPRAEFLPAIRTQYLSINTDDADVSTSASSCLLDMSQYQTIVIIVKIYSKNEDFPTVWENINKALTGYMPENDSRNYISMRHLEGNMLSVQNSISIWADKYAINIERVRQSGV